MTKFIDLTGQIFTRLTVIKRVKNNKWNQVCWLCKCICGKETIVRGADLRGCRTKSCGCLSKEKLSERRSLPKGEASFHQICNNYKQSAKKRGIEFTLTIEQFRILINGNCIYCGIEPEQIYKGHEYTNGEYTYNGIDRIDNNLGYTVDNCVSCCSKCNGMKEKLTQEEFLNHIKRIYNNMENR